MHLLFAIIVCLGFLATSARAETVAGLQLIQNKERKTLQNEQAAWAGPKVEQLMATCNFSDKTHPSILPPKETKVAFQNAQLADHLRLKLNKPIKVAAFSGPVRFDSIIATLDTNGPGAHIFTTINFKTELVRHTKCSGLVFAEILCHESMAVHLKPRLKDYCVVFSKN